MYFSLSAAKFWQSIGTAFLTALFVSNEPPRPGETRHWFDEEQGATELIIEKTN